MTEDIKTDFFKERMDDLGGVIFTQLMQIPQFAEYFAAHYDLDFKVDDEAQTVVVSVNPVSLEETANRLRGISSKKLDEGPKIITNVS